MSTAKAPAAPSDRICEKVLQILDFICITESLRNRKNRFLYRKMYLWGEKVWFLMHMQILFKAAWGVVSFRLQLSIINYFLYACHLTDVLWYDSVRPSVRSVVHNPCGKDIARIIWPRMLKLSVYTLYGQKKKPIYFQGQISRSLGLFKEFWHLNPCGQDIARTIQPRLLKNIVKILVLFYHCFVIITLKRKFQKICLNNYWVFVLMNSIIHEVVCFFL